ncbi:ATP-binding protein [uncultured Jatrophihabitans sp.]|uniref:ATP-binding protein n=1 Tax=uncultured Jatrophihabitans sp. TaxID=1610747 RepID=UPI0035CC4E43
MAGQIERDFVADARAPGAARAFAREALDDLLGPHASVDLRDDLQLIVSELVTNAVRAGSPRVQVALGLERTRVVVRVTDSAVGWPEQRAASDKDPGGRGLPLVSALSATWGVRLVQQGKVVWAELAVPAQ